MRKVIAIVLLVLLCMGLLMGMTACGFDFEISIPRNENYGERQEVDERDISNYQFVKENYYSFSPRFGGNETMIVKFSDITESSVTIEYLSHDLGDYGKDQYYAESTTAALTYNTDEECYEFEFCGYWRLYRGRIEYNRYWIHRYYNQDFQEVDPIEPEDIWWYEEAIAQTEN